MQSRYQTKTLDLPPPRMTRQAAVMVFLGASAIWSIAVLIARIALHWN